MQDSGHKPPHNLLSQYPQNNWLLTLDKGACLFPYIQVVATFTKTAWMNKLPVQLTEWQSIIYNPKEHYYSKIFYIILGFTTNSEQIFYPFKLAWDVAGQRCKLIAGLEFCLLLSQGFWV